MQFLIGSLFGTKCDLLDLLLGKGKVMVHLDARREGVEVPAQFKHDHHLRLKLSLWFGIDDFVYDDDSVRASLSFGGKRFYCVLPWHAIFAMTSHVEPIGYLWPEDLPSELASQLTPSATPPPGAKTDRLPHGQRGFRVVDGGKIDGQVGEPSSPADVTPQSERASAPRDGAPQGTPEFATGVSDSSSPDRIRSADSEADEERSEADDEEGRRYGHLRVVK